MCMKRVTITVSMKVPDYATQHEIKEYCISALKSERCALDPNGDIMFNLDGDSILVSINRKKNQRYVESVGSLQARVLAIRKNANISRDMTGLATRYVVLDLTAPTGGRFLGGGATKLESWKNALERLQK
jgi:hypothetical protein